MLNEKTKTLLKKKYEEYYNKFCNKFNFKMTTIVGLGLVFLLFVYYSVFGLLLNSGIRKDLTAKTEAVAELNTLGVASYIINQEVEKNLWTPNLPAFFPTYFLDNLPNFQLGEMEATANVVNAISDIAKNDKKLARAAKLLSYDGRIWMFDKKGVLPVPSSGSQYKRGHQALKKSDPLNKGMIIDKSSLLYILSKITIDVNKTLNEIDKAINNNDEVDDVFYYNQGKIYAYALFIKAICVDYKALLVENDFYADMSYISQAFADGAEMSPKVVKNAEKSSASAAHLYTLGYYIQKALLKLNDAPEVLNER